ncbi:MAG: glutathione S-transferase [Cryomorphaceae bacterium]|jgi:glutathione S-transferase
MIKLHHLRIGRSIFTVWLLEELNADYEMDVYIRNDMGRAPPELKNAHPLGKSPVIEHDGLVLSESGAINSYLLALYDKDNRLSPPQSQLKEWATYTQWLAYPEGSVFAPLLLKMLLLRSGVDHPVIAPFSDSEITLHLNHIADQLGDNDYILGEFSGADFGIAYVVSMAERLGQLGDYPSLQAYWDRMQQRDAWKTAIEKGVE